MREAYEGHRIYAQINNPKIIIGGVFNMTIKMFLASSIVKLYDERNAIGDLFDRLNQAYRMKYGVHFNLERCEDSDDAVRTNGSQAKYDEDIAESDTELVIFAESVGECTKHEVDVALKSLEKKGSPQIYVLFKLDSEGEISAAAKAFSEEYSDRLRSFDDFGSMTELKLHVFNIAMDFLKMRGKTGPRVHLAEGRLKVDDTIIIDLRKASSKELELLKI